MLSGVGVWSLGVGIGVGILLLVSSVRPRVMNQAISTPETPSTKTIANTHGNALLFDSLRLAPDLICG